MEYQAQRFLALCLVLSCFTSALCYNQGKGQFENRELR